MRRIVNVLWTGGLDSSCRIAELSVKDVIVQPYYVLDKRRKSLRNEMKAISKISQIIRNKKNTICELRDCIFIDIDTISPNEEITNAFKVLKSKYIIGDQYDWLARLAHEKALDLEVCIENSPRSKAHNAINGECSLIKDERDGVSVLTIDKANSSKEACLVFDYLRFPLSIWEMAKTEEVEEMKNLGLGEIVPETWFCHRPVLGKPCGRCNPCKDALNEGMAYRVPLTGRMLGLIRHYTCDAVLSILGK